MTASTVLMLANVCQIWVREYGKDRLWKSEISHLDGLAGDAVFDISIRHRARSPANPGDVPCSTRCRQDRYEGTCECRAVPA